MGASYVREVSVRADGVVDYLLEVLLLLDLLLDLPSLFRVFSLPQPLLPCHVNYTLYQVHPTLCIPSQLVQVCVDFWDLVV